MTDFFVAIVTAFGVVFLAELGDKTQLLALGYGARYRLRVVIAGLALGFGLAGAVASIVGGVLGATLPERPLSIAAGLLFLIFAVLTLRDEDDDDDGEAPQLPTRHIIMSIGFSIAIAEVGDKTQLATAALAAKNQPIGTWVGATAGTVAAATIGAYLGQRIGNRLDAKVIRYASAGLFAVFGILLLVTA
jgi:putative Ca2+/H+ antiporter (TMEM165/GDT1 family)